MFIKIADNPERYINTDNIELINFGVRSAGANPQCQLYFRSGRALLISEQAGSALIEFTEANNAALLDEAEREPAKQQLNGYVPSSPLRTRIAQHLRDNAPGGALLLDLLLHFDTQETQTLDALQELQEERVVVTQAANGVLRFYHASNAPKSDSVNLASGHTPGK